MKLSEQKKLTLSLMLPKLPSMPPGDRFKFWREVKGLSKLAVAKQAGCSHTAISKLEHGRTTPSVILALALCQVIGVSPEMIWRT